MRRFIVSVARPALTLRPRTTFTSPLRPFATSGGKTNAPSTKDGDSSRQTGDYGPADSNVKPLEQEGQGGKGGPTGGNVGQRSDSSATKKSSTSSTSSTTSQQPKRSFATSIKQSSGGSKSGGSGEQHAPEGHQASQADAAAKAKAGKDATHRSPTPTPQEAQTRKASGHSAVKGQSATETHRKQEEYTKDRDLATGAEANVAADRAAHDPLPDKLKHSTKVQKGE